MAYPDVVPQTIAPPVRLPIWPLFLAPLVAGVYYIALRESFAFSLSSVVADASDISSNVLEGPRWGTHWIYRAFAEFACVPFAAFVAAGAAQQRAKLGGLIAGLTIAGWYLLRTLVIVYAYFNEYEVIERRGISRLLRY